MYATLNTGAIGVKTNGVHEAIIAAKLGGYAGIELRAPEVADLIDTHGVDTVRTLLSDAGVRAAVWGLGMNLRDDDAAWDEALVALRRNAAAMAAIDCTRVTTVLMSGSDERDYDANWRFQVERLKPVAAILADHGCSLGLEYLGPQTILKRFKYPFVHTMAKALELGAAIGPNVGLLLDCWHWYTAGDDLDVIRTARAEQIVHVHINDAPTGIPLAEQIDNRRALPGETGVIDIAGFFGALQAIGYDGPVTAEPFKQELNDLPNDAARLATIRETIAKVFAQAGIK
jgi:sugar phosphate isomerase/epimerase